MEQKKTIREILGANMRRLRKSAGMSQADCARYCGVTRTAWGYWEAGTHAVSVDRLPGIADAIGDTDIITLLAECKPVA